MRKAYTIGDNFYGPREELSFSASSQLTKSWKIYGNYRYDLSNGGEPVEAGLTLQYDNECTAVLFDVSKSFTEDRDYKGSTSFMVKVILKTLGGV
jgi:lipopolysaccharide assembly outer membrane protein LptD (OstA)